MQLNQSVRKAVALIRAAAAVPGGEKASALARATGIPWATAVRLLRTLEEEGFLYRLSDSDRYVLGFELVQLARTDDIGLLLAAASRPALERLAQDVGETVNLTVVRPEGTLDVVAQIDPPHLIRPTDWVGRPLPVHASSIGKLLLAESDERQLEAIFAKPLARLTPNTITDPAALRAELDQIRADGYASIVDELEPGLSAVSVGVYDARAQLVAVVSLSGPSFRFDEGARARAVGPLRTAADAAARALSPDEESTPQTKPL
jgi:DNA-binding IclR family transcriptional regulator